jgi:hypothetical protein
MEFVPTGLDSAWSVCTFPPLESGLDFILFVGTHPWLAIAGWEGGGGQRTVVVRDSSAAEKRLWKSNLFTLNLRFLLVLQPLHICVQAVIKGFNV